MKNIIFDAQLFQNEKDRRRSEIVLKTLLNALVDSNVEYLVKYPTTLPLYKARVRYKREDGTEVWKSIPAIIKDGHGDCEDLASWRVAELRVKGIAADTGILHQRKGNFSLYHIIVVYPDGKVEDPSKKLGMGRI